MIKILIYNDIFTSLKGTKKFKVRLNSSRNCSVWFVTSPEKEKEQFSWKTSWKLGKHGKSGWRTFEEETLYFEITETRERMSALKIYGGKEIKKLATYQIQRQWTGITI